MITKIGLTGGIASGKTHVAGLLSDRLGCELLDADIICRQLLEPNEKGWLQFVEVFGQRFLTGDRFIDRKLLRKELFRDRQIREKVNSILHPLVKETVVERLKSFSEPDGPEKIVVEVPLLYEARWQDLFNTVVVVFADHEVCLRRLAERDGIVEASAELEMKSQMPLEEKAAMADYVIDNSGSLQDTAYQVEQLAQMLKNNGR